MKRVWKAKAIIKGWQGKPLKILQYDDPFDEDETSASVGDMRVLDAMLVIANRFECKTLDDASKKKQLKQAVMASVRSGRIELEAEVYKWLKTASEQVCPVAWQDNANEVHDILTEGYAKENEPSESKREKALKESKDATETEESTESRTEEK